MKNFKDEDVGNLFVVDQYKKGQGYVCLVYCKCDPDKSFEVYYSQIKRGYKKSCGCLDKSKYKVGDKIGRLTLKEKNIGGAKKQRCLFVCECGRERKTSIQNVLNSKYRQCSRC